MYYAICEIEIELNMKVVIAIDSFKGSLSSPELSRHISDGIRNVFPDAEIISLPVADGGEGTVEALVHGTGGKIVECTVNDPLMRPVKAKYGILGDGTTAVIEMAEASGLPLLKEKERNPLNTSTFGTGELIKDALSNGCREFIIGIGGSATNDLGMGMIQALGGQFFDISGNELSGMGKAMTDVENIDLSEILPELKESNFTIACDVDNPLYGKNGAAYVYAPQKGADEKMVIQLDNGLRSLSEKIKIQLGKDISDIPGAGAAGGLGGAFVAFLDAKLKPGIEIVLNTLDFEKKIENADVVVTGEGRIDAQSVMGKAPVGVAKRCSKKNIPVIAFAGSLADDASETHAHGITTLFSIMNYPITLEEAMKAETTSMLIQKNTEEVFRLIKAFK